MGIKGVPEKGRNIPLEVYPSLMAADFLHLERDLRAIRGAQGIHFDVMDGHFVPNITFGKGMLQAIRCATILPVHVHLMAERPQDIIPQLLPYLTRSDVVFLHIEIPKTDFAKSAKLLEQAKIPWGLTLRPSTSVERLAPMLCAHKKAVKGILVLGAEPGFYGQRMQGATAARVRRAVALPRAPRIYVDEGVTLENAKQLKAAGACGVVSGHAVFFSKGMSPASVIAALRKL